MTPHQFAVATGGDAKWLLNSAALLRRRVRHTPEDARWWGLVRQLTDTLGLPLQRAAAAATIALSVKGQPCKISISPGRSGSASVLIDMVRYQSIFLLNLSRALVQATPKRRGRPSASRDRGAADSAAHYGIDLGLVRAALNRTPAERLELLEANAEFVRAMRKGRNAV